MPIEQPTKFERGLVARQPRRSAWRFRSRCLHAQTRWSGKRAALARCEWWRSMTGVNVRCRAQYWRLAVCGRLRTAA